MLLSTCIQQQGRQFPPLPLNVSIGLAARAWFLKIALVHASVCMCVCLSVCLPRGY